MREIDFLPPWYTQLHRRRVLLRAQTWLSIVAVVVAAGFLIQARQKLSVARAGVTQLEENVRQVRSGLTESNRLASLQAQLKSQEAIRREIGIDVGTSRLIAEIDQCLPPRVSLRELTFEVTQTSPPVVPGQKPGEPQRELAVMLRAVAPMEADVSDTFAKLNKRKFFRGFELLSKQTESKDVLMRDFEIRFQVPLNFGDLSETR